MVEACPIEVSFPDTSKGYLSLMEGSAAVEGPLSYSIPTECEMRRFIWIFRLVFSWLINPNVVLSSHDLCLPWNDETGIYVVDCSVWKYCGTDVCIRECLC